MVTAIEDGARAILKVLGNSGGYEKTSAIVRQLDPPQSEPTVRRTILDLVQRGFVKRAGKGGWLFGLTEQGAAAVNGQAPAAVRTGINYDIVLQDLERRRDELNAAIEAVRRLT